MDTNRPVRTGLKLPPFTAPAVDNRTPGTSMGLGGILDEAPATHASGLLVGRVQASAISLLRATSRRLDSLGPRLLPHDARQAMSMQRAMRGNVC